MCWLNVLLFFANRFPFFSFNTRLMPATLPPPVVAPPSVKVKRIKSNRLFFQGFLLLISIPATLITVLIMIPVQMLRLFTTKKRV